MCGQWSVVMWALTHDFLIQLHVLPEALNISTLACSTCTCGVMCAEQAHPSDLGHQEMQIKARQHAYRCGR